MSELVDYLLARLDEEEDAAKRAGFGWGADWAAEDRFTDGYEYAVIVAQGSIDAVTSEDGDVVRHIAIHDPARVLAEIAAKRAVLDHAERRCSDAATSGDPSACLIAGGVLEAVERLAQVYAGRDDFDPAWRS